jgi:hypothetical protein
MVNKSQVTIVTVLGFWFFRYVKDRVVGHVHHDAALRSGHPAADKSLPPNLTHSDHVVSKAAGESFLETQQAH